MLVVERVMQSYSLSLSCLSPLLPVHLMYRNIKVASVLKEVALDTPRLKATGMRRIDASVTLTELDAIATSRMSSRRCRMSQRTDLQQCASKLQRGQTMPVESSLPIQVAARRFST